MTQHIGPIPDPSTLERYNQVQPGFAERIVVMAEKEQANRHLNDTTILANQHKQHKRDTDTFRIGQVLALLSVLLIIGLCILFLKLGYASQGATVAVGAIAAVAAVFFAKNKKDNKQEQ